MGWDAFAQTDSGKDILLSGPNGGLMAHPEFAPVADRVVAETGAVDGMLRYGGLDVSTCGEMLERATGLDAWSDVWPADVVARAAREADWSFEVPEEQRWAKASAKAFLETLARHFLRVRFSW